MTPYPLVSAIVAAYNYGHFLPRTLDSALAQDYPPERLEIVVVDDGSTDDTPDVLAEYTARHPGRIRAVRQANAGYVAATNRAFAEARGELWALLDADDLWPADKTARQVEVFQARPEVGAVYSDMTVIDPDDHVVHESYWRHHEMVPVRGADALASLLADGNTATASTIMVRSALAARFAPIPPAVPYVDWWVVAQAAAVSELEYVHAPRVGYREHASNLTLGAQGTALVREKIKHSTTRRYGLIHGGAATLTRDELRRVWWAIENDVSHAAREAESVYLELPRPSVDEGATAARARARAAVLDRRGASEAALRHWALAAALDPFNAQSRGALRSAWAGLDSGGDPFAGARSFTALVEADELVAEPELLGAFADRFASDDDASLVIHGPGLSGAELEELLLGVFARAGVDPNGGVDVIALPDPGRHGEAIGLREAADVRLGQAAGGDLRGRYEAACSLLTPPGATQPLPPR
jgi:Glycosyl transferase family 2